MDSKETDNPKATEKDSVLARGEYLTKVLKDKGFTRGIEYEIKSFCSYLEIYYKVKIKYNLSFNNNHPDLFSKCSLNIK